MKPDWSAIKQHYIDCRSLKGSLLSIGLWSNMTVFIGIAALPTADGGIKSVMDGRLTATYVYPTGGAEAIEFAKAILEGGEAPPNTVVLETEQVTSDNAADLYAKFGGQ